MKTAAKFVINRNGIVYYYTEKVNDVSGFQYIVYNSQNMNAFTPESFYATFGVDQKIGINKFINYAQRDLTVESIYDENISEMIRRLEEIKKKIAGKSAINPPLWGTKEELLNLIDEYNHILTRKEEPEELIDYETEYALLNNLTEKEYVRNRQE